MSCSEIADDLPPIWRRGVESLDAWTDTADGYLRRRLRETFTDETPGDAEVLFNTLVNHERARPQDGCFYNYFMWLALRIVTHAEEMPELEGQAPALARLYCLLANEGERREGDGFLTCNETIAQRRDEYAIHYPLVPPGFYGIRQLYDIIPDPNFIPPASPAELAQFGRELASATRFWRFLAYADTVGAFAIEYYNYPGGMTTPGWYPGRLSQAATDPAHRHDMDLIVAALSPLALWLRDEEAIGQSEWGKSDEGLDNIQALKTELKEVSAIETLQDITRARLAVLYEDITATSISESDATVLHWRHWLVHNILDVPSSLGLHAAFSSEMERMSDEPAPIHGTRCDAALQFIDAIFACAECEDYIPILAPFYSLIVHNVDGNTGLPDDNDINVHLYEHGIRPKLGDHLIRPGYHLVDSYILPDPSWTGTLDFSTLVAYGREYASWLRLWSFLGHLDARIDSPLPHNDFPGHFVLTYWTPARVRCALRHPGHHTDLDMLVVALQPLRDWLSDGAEMIDGTTEMRDELVDAVKEVILCEDVPEITRARLAETLEYLGELW